MDPIEAFKAREIALAVATQTATAKPPGSDVAGDILKDAERYLAFLMGDRDVGEPEGNA